MHLNVDVDCLLRREFSSFPGKIYIFYSLCNILARIFYAKECKMRKERRNNMMNKMHTLFMPVKKKDDFAFQIFLFLSFRWRKFLQSKIFDMSTDFCAGYFLFKFGAKNKKPFSIPFNLFNFNIIQHNIVFPLPFITLPPSLLNIHTFLYWKKIFLFSINLCLLSFFSKWIFLIFFPFLKVLTRCHMLTI